MNYCMWPYSVYVAQLGPVLATKMLLLWCWLSEFVRYWILWYVWQALLLSCSCSVLPVNLAPRMCTNNVTYDDSVRKLCSVVSFKVVELSWCTSGLCTISCILWLSHPSLHSSHCCSKQVVFGSHQGNCKW